jgi:hemolysin activation/secretion protein
VKPGSLLNFRVLEADLNRINRLNDGYKVKAFLAAGDHPGQTNVKLKVAERQPLQISGTFDNQGRPFIGMYRSGIEFRDDSLTTLGDRLYGQWSNSQGTQVAIGSYMLPLNRFGTELNTSFAYSKVNLMLPVKDPPVITGKSYSTSLGISQPLDRERHWIADIGVNWQRVGSYFDGDKTSDTDIRDLQAGLTYDRFDRWGRTYNRTQSTFAMGGLGSSVRSSRFWKVENYFNRLVVLPKNNLLILKAYAQMTPDALPAAQQFQIGGENSVRGYTEGLLIGDRGLNLGIEHRFPVPGLKWVSPWLSQRVQAAWFYDYGRVWLDHSNETYVKGISDVKQRTLLQSVGFGFRAQLTRFLQGYVDFGFGLGDRKDVEPLRRQPTARVHFGIRTDLMPMAYRMRGNTVSIYAPRHLSMQSKRNGAD